MDEAADLNLRLEAFGDGAGACDIDFIVALLNLHRHIDFAQLRARSRPNSDFDTVRRQGRRDWRVDGESGRRRNRYDSEADREWCGDCRVLEIIGDFRASRRDY